MVEHADHGVGSLACAKCLIDKVVHLSGDTLATHSKDGTLPSCLEVHQARLEWVGGYWICWAKSKEKCTPKWYR